MADNFNISDQPGGGGAGVDSFNGRTGVVVAAASDYDASQIDNDSGVAGAFVDDALDTLATAITSLGTDDIANDSGVSGGAGTASDALNALDTPQRVSVFNSTAQSIPDVTPTILNFDSERFDTDTMHDNVTNNSRITFTTAGTYAFGGNVKWEGDSGGDFRLTRVLLNGTDEILYDNNRDASGTDDANTFSGIRTFAASDFIELEVEHDEGAALDVRAGADLIQFWAHRIQ